ncbi:efflux RND transporter periplasmic adaptor subunit [Bacillus sp. REN3]|uniref:efflux RND transporter periplasmic adaptor subunit n=1 Tax=Bacillus sp. REN3 TaxID=2802440 RepID=UPI001AEF2800|nr:efflux RND transporter periplasmic adaptor subunit [Bacillus sp. REN3]
MKKKTAILLSAGILFVSANLYLALKDDSKAVRSSYITKWEAIGKEKLTETLKASGVVTPAEEHYVYYNDNPGGFKKFLVKEGDQVNSGSPLYEYASENVATDKTKLEVEKSQLVREATLIDEQIQQLLYLQSVSSSTSDSSTPVTGDGTIDSGSSSNELVKVSIEKEIYDKQLEKGRIMAEIQKYDETIRSHNSGDQLGINSDVDGTVKKINYDLKNPIVTIISDKPKVEGTFTERDLKKVEEGMEAYIKSDLIKKKAAGTLTKIAAFPEKDPSVKEESNFPFEVQLDEENEEIIKGAHVDVTIVTDKVLNAATVPARAIEKGKKNHYIYVLNEKGEVEKRKIKKGMEQAGKVEISKGAKPSELIVRKPEQIQQENSPFFSKAKPSTINQMPFNQETKRNILKHIIVAFFK